MSSSSKLSRDTLRRSLDELLAYARHERRRNFLETVELQIVLKNYNMQRDKRFSGAVRLPHVIRPRLVICVYGDEKHCDEARASNVPCMSVDDLKCLNRDRKKVRRLDHRYDAFLASETIIRLIPRLLGPGLGKVGKFPTLLRHDETVVDKVQQVRSTLKVQLKKHPNICVPIGNVDMDIEQLITTTTLSVNFIVGLTRKHWQSIDKIFIKSTMGKCHRLY